MSLYSTSSPSIEQTRLYFTRPPSVACTWWKRMSLSSVAEYSFTPMLTSPKDTAPRQIDRMPPLPQGDPTWAPRRPVPGQDHTIGAQGHPRQVDGLPVSPGRRTSGFHPGGLPGARRRRQRAVLDGVVDELQDVGAGHHRHREGRQPGGLGRGDVAEHEAGADPLRQAEGAGEQLPDRVLDAAVLAHLLGHLRVARGALEPDEGCPHRGGHRVLGD